MAVKTIGAKIVLEGENEYKAAVKRINAEQKELTSEMKLAQAQFEGSANSTEALTAKLEILEKQQELALKKWSENAEMLERAKEAQEQYGAEVDTLNSQLEEAREEYDRMLESGTATTEEIQRQKDAIADLESQLGTAEQNLQKAEEATTKWQTATNNADAELTKFGNDIDRTNSYLEEAKNSSDGCATSINEFGKRIGSAKEEGGALEDVLLGTFAGGALTMGIGEAIELLKEMGVKLYEVALNTAFYADEVNTLATQTELSTETIQELKYMEELLDVSVETVTSSLAKNNRSMYEAAKGTGNAAEAYRKLGIEVRDTTTGALRDNEEVFWEVIDALHEMDNASERDALAMQLLGRNAKTLNPLIKAGSEGYRELADEAHRAGYILDQETLDSLNDASDAHEKFSKSVDAVKDKLGAQLAPALESAESNFAELGTAVANNIELAEAFAASFALEALTNPSSIAKLPEYISNFEAAAAVADTMKESTDEVAESTEALAEATDDAVNEFEALAEATIEYNDHTVTLTGLTEEQAEKVTELQEAYDKAKESALDSLNSQIGLFEELKVESDTSVSQMTENLLGQAEQLTLMEINLESLKGKISDDLLKSLASLGVDGAGYIAELASASDEELAKVSDAFTQVTTAKDELSTDLADIQTGFGEFVEGMTGMDFESAGQAVGTGVAQGVTTSSAEVKASQEQLANDMKVTATTTIKAADYQQIGQQVDAGIAAGIDAGVGTVTAAITRLANRMIAQLKKDLDIHSPSRVFAELGEYTAEGFRVGWMNASGDVIDGVTETMREVTSRAAEVDLGSASVNLASDSVQNATNSIASGIGGAVQNALGGLEINANINIEADNRELFNVVRSEADVYRKTTGEGAF